MINKFNYSQIDTVILVIQFFGTLLAKERLFSRLLAKQSEVVGITRLPISHLCKTGNER